MGLYDRDYVQEQRSYSSFSGASMVTKIIVVTVVVFLIDNFSELFGAPANWLNSWIRLDPDVFVKPWKAYQFLTYGFAHAPMSSDRYIWHIVFNMYNLWLFGRAVEQRYGSREFLLIYLVIMILSALSWAILERLTGGQAYLIGASGAVTGILILFALNFPHQKFILFPIPIPVPAWAIGVFLVLLDVRGAMSGVRGLGGDNVAFSVHLTGAALALVYYYSGLRLAGSWVSKWKLPTFGGRSKLRIHDPGRRSADLDRRADLILEKVHQHGADSITSEERRILDDYSRKLRQKRQ